MDVSPLNARDRLRLRLATAVSAGVGALAGALGPGEGNAIAGKALLAVDPDALVHAVTGRRVGLISGSNGKTTTSRMITEALRTQGPVCANTAGANMTAGLAAALATSTATTAVLEVDEAYLPAAVRDTHPQFVVLTNLSRDQLDRHAEVSNVARRWRATFATLPPTCTVVANADDPLTAWAAMTAPTVTWVSAGRPLTADASLCPDCGGPIAGVAPDWQCTLCGLQRPQPAWGVDGLALTDPAGATHEVTLALPGRINLVNAALAAAAVDRFGIAPQVALAAAARVGSVQGRYAVVDVRGRRLQLLLAKNPASWNELLDDILDTDDPLVIANNGRAADGRDLSWLWDVDFERLRGRSVAVIGDRRLDVAVRLDVAGVAPTVAADLDEALQQLPPAARIHVVASYTALGDLRRELAQHKARP